MKSSQIMLLVDEHSQWLFAMAYQFAYGTGMEPGDLVQETLLAVAGLDSPPEFPKTWLWRTLRNIAISARRSRERRDRRELSGQVKEKSEDNPLRQMIRVEECGTLRRMIGMLAECDRELLVAIHWGGLTFSEAAEVLGIPSSTLHRKYQALLALLKRQLIGLGGDENDANG